jgi:hypothetical protein
VRVQEETYSTPRRMVEATQPQASCNVEAQPSALHPPLGLDRTLDELAIRRRTLENEIAESLKQVVDKMNIAVDKVEKTAKVCVVLHPDLGNKLEAYACIY